MITFILILMTKSGLLYLLWLNEFDLHRMLEYEGDRMNVSANFALCEKFLTQLIFSLNTSFIETLFQK